MPRHRFMSAYEQRIEPPDRRWQYLLMAAEPYETIAFKVGRWSLSLSLSPAHTGRASPGRALPLGWERVSRGGAPPQQSSSPVHALVKSCV